MGDTRKYRYIREEIQEKNASYTNNKNKVAPKPENKLEDDLVILGENWFHIGHTLDEAEIDLKNNRSFVRGYKHALTQSIVEEQLYQLGIEYFNKGTPLNQIPANYIDKDCFMRGYNEALRLSLVNDNKGSRR